MNIRRLYIGLAFLSVVFVELHRVNADNIYRINTRAYRHMMATNTHAYRNMMYTRYPSQFGQDIRGFVNNSVLQPQGPVDQLIQRLLQRVAAAEQQNDTDASLVAKSEASPDPDLTATLEKTRDILKTLKVEEPKRVTTTVPPAPGNGVIPVVPNKDFSHFEDQVP